MINFNQVNIYNIINRFKKLNNRIIILGIFIFINKILK